ncbi:conserved hypothetical protein [Desulfarculus baarsii DSM 2075]|uniref:Uncharacterized protein n=1 Tax=Desulfarculus baarsii (strain ATCC 33931 / DSM 2075 / LMG 7858 / VKM B-1802 / 2st14) TaxID=644282 RepID=E1QJ32_DESB2|nr:hypothetical protein [Desulfarculus baarsii]ADK85575.1 conserved hypothetical protein [Desulfarculus baarsii DSM 2075]
MAFTFGAIARVGAQSAMAIGQAKAASQGLDEDSGNALAVTSMLDDDNSSNLVGNLLSSNKKKNNTIGAQNQQQNLYQANKDILGGLFSFKA